MRPRLGLAGVLLIGAAALSGVLLGRARLAAADPPPPPLVFTVDTSADGVDVTPGDGICQDATGHCTLRAAIEESDRYVTPATNSIFLNTDVKLSIPPVGKNDNSSGDLDVVRKVAIFGRYHTIDANLLDRAFHLRAGKLNLNSVVIVRGHASGANPVGGAVWNQGFLNLNRSTLWFDTANGAGSAGGAIYGNVVSTTHVKDSAFWFDGAHGPDAGDGRGGAIATDGALEMSGTTVGVSFAGSAGTGALDLAGSSATIVNSTIKHNPGGSRLRAATNTVTGSTFTDAVTIGAGVGAITNSTIDVAGGIPLTAGGESLALVADTIVTRPGDQVIDNAFGVTVAGSILYGSCNGGPTSEGWNIGTDILCGLNQPTDQPTSGRSLLALADNGGPTPTRLPYAGSSSIDAIPLGTPGLCDGSLAVDQRGVARPQNGACDIGAVEGSGPAAVALSLTVNSATDASDANLGDGVCDDGSGACTLRAAIDETDQRPAANTIDIAPGIDPSMTIDGRGEGENRTGDFDVTNPVAIHGHGATIDAQQIDRIFDVAAGSMALDNVIVTRGRFLSTDGLACRGGGGITADAPLVLDHVTVTGSGSFDSDCPGGGVAARGDLTLVHSTISNNQDVGLGTGLYAAGPSTTVSDSTVSGNLGSLHFSGDSFDSPSVLLGGGTASISGSTISGNRSVMINPRNTGGGVLVTAASATITNSSVVDNLLDINPDLFNEPGQGPGGVGITAAGGTLSLVGDTISGNNGQFRPAALKIDAGTVTAAGTIINGTVGTFGLPGADCSQPVLVSQGWNVISDASCGTPDATDQVSTDPLLHLTADNGGPTRTQLPFTGSAAVDAIPAGTPGLCDGTLATDQRGVARPQGTACDIGAVEGSGGTLTALALTVDVAADGNDAVPGDGTCDDGSGHCPLRAAVEETNRRPGGLANTITIAAGIDPTLTIGVGLFDQENATNDLDVAGPVTIHGNGATIASVVDRAIHVLRGPVAIDHATLISGQVFGDGAVIRADGDLTLSDTTLADGQTDPFFQSFGGGLSVNGGHATLDRVTISGNTALDGGGVAVRGASTSATITNSTISGNTGAAISVTDGSVQLILDTVASGTGQPGLEVKGGGSITMAGTIVATSGTVCSGAVTSLGYNIATDATCGLTGTGDHAGTNALLGPLGPNGGPTATHLPAAGSPAINAIPTGTAGLCDGTVATDQRGVTRPQGSACDIGAVEQ